MKVKVKTEEETKKERKVRTNGINELLVSIERKGRDEGGGGGGMDGKQLKTAVCQLPVPNLVGVVALKQSGAIRLGWRGLALHPPHAIQSIIRHKLGKRRKAVVGHKKYLVLVRRVDAKPIQTDSADGAKMSYKLKGRGAKTRESPSEYERREEGRERRRGERDMKYWNPYFIPHLF